MVPHERSLVQKMTGKQFVLLGVNSDEKEVAKAWMEKHKITWRSFWDGGSPSGPIAMKYHVSAWPTVYVIDHKGIVRHADAIGEALDLAVEKLVAQVEHEQAIKQ